MRTLEEMKALAQKVSRLCPEYMRQGIRHLQRNCDVECPTHEDDWENCDQPDRYDGDTIAQVLTAAPKLLAALEAALATADALIEENQDATTLQSWGLMTAAQKVHTAITEALA